MSDIQELHDRIYDLQELSVRRFRLLRRAAYILERVQGGIPKDDLASIKMADGLSVDEAIYYLLSEVDL